MKKKVSKKAMKKKRTKAQADLSARTVRGGLVMGGATDIFAKIGTIKGESDDGPERPPTKVLSSFMRL
jgi:hypothetical protein